MNMAKEGENKRKMEPCVIEVENEIENYVERARYK